MTPWGHVGHGEFPCPRSNFPSLGHRHCFHDAEVAGGDSECFLPCAPGETPRTHLFPASLWALRGCWGCPITARMQVLVPGLLCLFPAWDAASSLPSIPGCQLEPCPQHQPSLGTTFLLAEPQPNKKRFPLSISYLLQDCLAPGREMGL